MVSKTLKFLLCLCTFSSFLSSYAYRLKNPIVETKYGPVVGLTQYSRKAREYMSFRGIPYAKPPVGELRFKAPEPPESWSFAVNATHDAPYCIQKNYLFANPKVEGKEDCLYLNIYVPKTNYISKLLPVMVFIHWGGFFAGRSSSDILGPEYFMDKDVILVTFNYRLGVFGFFTTLDDNAPGNYALKDQVLALRFVQENIENFGGDKNRVTIFGQSAGAGSTSLHMVSPLSKGLFQQAISQSGVGLNLWAKPANALQPNVTAALAFFVGCGENIGDNANLVKCLRKLDPEVLVESGDKFKYFSVEPLTTYTLVTEVKTEDNPNPFITKEPLEYFQAGEFQKVPWIVGNVGNEGNLRAEPIVRQTETYNTLNANFSALLPQILLLQLSTGPNFTTLYNNIVNFYLNGNNFIDRDDPKSVQGFIDLYSDRAFVYGTYQSIILQSQKEHRPIWVYNFNYEGQFSYGNLFAATNENINFPWGVSHCDELLYLFKSPALFPDLEKESDLYMSDIMLTLWTNFAILGDPDPMQVVKWKSLTFNSPDEIHNENIFYLDIQGSEQYNSIELTIGRGYFPKRMQFWVNQSIAENFPGLK